MQSKVKAASGFSILEVLIFLTTLVILVASIFIFLKPTEQLAQSRNSQRSSDLSSILKAIYLYESENDSLKSVIPITSDCLSASRSEICRTDIPTASCTNMINLSLLTKGSKYLVNLPLDPSSQSGDGTGYNIVRNTNNKITVCAPLAEDGESISVTQ